MPANPKAGKALLRRLPMEERFGMAQFSHLPWHTELNCGRRDSVASFPGGFNSAPIGAIMGAQEVVVGGTLDCRFSASPLGRSKPNAAPRRLYLQD